MNEDKSYGVFCAIAFCAILCFVVGAYVGTMTERGVWHVKTIEQGVAQHNAITGKWQWKTNIVAGGSLSERVVVFRK